MAEVVFFEPPPEDDETVTALRTLQRVIAIHPVAAQALFATLVVEGRRYAETPEGAELRDSLYHSELVQRLRVVWDSLTTRALDDNKDTVLPTAILEAMVHAASRADMETFLTEHFSGEVFGPRPK